MSYQFSGAASNHIRWPYVSALANATKAWMSVWIKVTGAGTFGGNLFGVTQASTGYHGLYINAGNGSDLSLRVDARNNTTERYKLTSNSQITSDTWRHIFVVYDGTQATSGDRLRLWIHGTEYTTPWTESGTLPTSIGALTTGDYTHVGSRYDAANEPITGYIAEAALWVGLGAPDVGVITGLAGGDNPRNLTDYDENLYFYAALKDDSTAWTPTGDVTASGSSGATLQSGTHPTIDAYSGSGATRAVPPESTSYTAF